MLCFCLCAVVRVAICLSFFFFQAEDGIRDHCVTGVQTCLFRSGGYPSFERLPAALRWKRRLQPLVPAMTPMGSAVLPERLTSRWQHFMSGNGRMDAAYRTQRGLFMPAEIERLAGPALRDRWTAAADRLADAESLLFDGAAS